MVFPPQEDDEDDEDEKEEVTTTEFDPDEDGGLGRPGRDWEIWESERNRSDTNPMVLRALTIYI